MKKFVGERSGREVFLPEALGLSFGEAQITDRKNSLVLRWYDGEELLAKSCSACHHVKLGEEFPRAPRYKDGKHAWCLKCSLLAVQRGIQNRKNSKPTLNISESDDSIIVTNHVGIQVTLPKTFDLEVEGAKVRNAKNSLSLRWFDEGGELIAKSCSICRLVLPSSGFPTCKRSKDGKQGICLSCKRRDNKTRRQDEEYRKFDRQQTSKWVRNNRDYFNNWHHNRYHNDQEFRINTLLRGHDSRYFRGESMTAHQREFFGPIFEMYDAQKCAITSTTEDIHMDHVFPVSRGGTGSSFNYMPISQELNGSKTDRNAFEFYKSVNLLEEFQNALEPILEHMRLSLDEYRHAYNIAFDKKVPLELVAMELYDLPEHITKEIESYYNLRGEMQTC